jgi:hypothetical protein
MTQWNPGLTKLRDILAGLYPTEILSREVVDQAGIPTKHIRFDAAANSNWHAVLKEAHLRKMVPAIVAVARGEYPEQKNELNEAELEYLRWLAQPPEAEDDVTPAEETQPAAGPTASKYHINAAGATIGAIGDGARVEQQINRSGSSRDGEAGAAAGLTVEEQRTALEDELAQHQRNLARLRAKKAIYAAGEEPLSLLNQIEAEEGEIERVQAELEQLAAD